MYHPAVIEKRLNRLADGIRRSIDPRFEFRETPLSEIEARSAELEDIYDSEAEKLRRPLTRDEEAFIRHEINRSKVDFGYWAHRFAKIKTKSQELLPLTFTHVQTLLMKKIADAEIKALQGTTGDGILLAVLKARQLGVSTISEAIISHRIFFYGNTSALIAADVDERSSHLFGMTVRIYDNLPWWMRPVRTYFVKGKQMYFKEQDSIITVMASKNMQGGDSGSDKGSVGTGQTYPLVHLSELALWENPQQIDDALMPSIPMHARTFCIFESTAKGRGNWWHEKWLLSKRGLSRRTPVFIPWYTDPETYKLPAPVDWTPNEISKAHAQRVKETSPLWLGYSMILSKDQLYWWERTRAEHVADRKLPVFLAEYAADDLEAFQNTTIGVFPAELIDGMKLRATRYMPTLVEIRPRMGGLADAERAG